MIIFTTYLSYILINRKIFSFYNMHSLAERKTQLKGALVKGESWLEFRLCPGYFLEQIILLGPDYANTVKLCPL